MTLNVGLVATLSLAVFAYGSAKADTFTFTDGTNIVSFSLPASPIPTGVYPDCPNAGSDGFCVDNQTVLVNGVATQADLNFFSNGNNGGVLFNPAGLDAPIINQDGLPLFTGTLADPTFLPGFYIETNEQDAGPTNEFSNGFNVTITGTPEPSSLVLVGTGVLTAFGALRRKLRTS